jgi:hypothetical protein
LSNPYEVLGVHPDADDEVIELVYEQKVKENHPDQGGSSEEFKKIKQAYEKISSEGDTNDSQNEVSSVNLTGYPVETHAIDSRWGESLRIEGDQMAIRLLGLYKTDVSEIIFDVNGFATPDITDSYIIILNVKNVSNHLQKYKPLSNLKVVGDDEFSYEPPPTSQFDDHSNVLPPRMSTGSVELEPQTQTNSLTIAKGMPEDVCPSEIIYTHHKFEGDQIDGVVEGKEKFAFEIDQSDWPQLMPPNG